MARGNIATRAWNVIFRASPDIREPEKQDSDLEALGFGSPPINMDMRQYSTYREERNSWDWYAEQLAREMKRSKKYDIFNEMDTDSPELSSALDIYADNTVRADEGDCILTINTDNERVKEILTAFVRDVKLEDKLWSIARNLAKYGESFEELVLDKSLKPVRMKSLPGKYVVRNEDEFGRLQPVAFLQKSKKTDKVIAQFKKWQVIQFRVQKNGTDLYGTSVLDPAVKVYRQLAMMEDSMVIARLTRAQQKYAFMVDVDGKTDDEAFNHIDRVKNRMKKRKTVNPRTGRQDLNYNPLAAEEDVYIGTREKAKADVKVLQGDTNLSNIKDVHYFQNKLFSATKVPKSYLGLEGDVNSKGTVTEQEIQFARTGRRIQQAILTGVDDLFDFVLSLNGIDRESVTYQIAMPAISMVDELRKWQARLVKVQVAKEYKTLLSVDEEFTMRHYLKMSEEEIQEALEHRDEMADVANELAKVNLDHAKNPPEPAVNSTGGSGNKAPKKNPTDTGHNLSNSANRKSTRTSSTQTGAQTTRSATRSEDERLALIQKVMTERITEPDELLDALQAWLETSR